MSRQSTRRGLRYVIDTVAQTICSAVKIVDYGRMENLSPVQLARENGKITVLGRLNANAMLLNFGHVIRELHIDGVRYFSSGVAYPVYTRAAMIEDVLKLCVNLSLLKFSHLTSPLVVNLFNDRSGDQIVVPSAIDLHIADSHIDEASFDEMMLGLPNVRRVSVDVPLMHSNGVQDVMEVLRFHHNVRILELDRSVFDAATIHRTIFPSLVDRVSLWVKVRQVEALRSIVKTHGWEASAKHPQRSHPHIHCCTAGFDSPIWLTNKWYNPKFSYIPFRF